MYISNVSLDILEIMETNPPNVAWSEGIGMLNCAKSEPAEKK